MNVCSKSTFQIGDEVEVCCNAEGFLGSYWKATIVADMGTNYLVEYEDFVDEDQSTPLQETVIAKDVRPIPPVIMPSKYSSLEGYKVDVLINDGWWVGTISWRQDSDHYFVFFETTGTENAYPLSKLRFHMEWLNGIWVPPNKRRVPFSSEKRYTPTSSNKSKKRVGPASSNKGFTLQTSKKRKKSVAKACSREEFEPISFEERHELMDS
uniref:uncharacterized protein LOC105349752 n=1 Tax=Fragaria vesca subsp. vesca TaxID=101020 RepID=UPI0005CB498F|nr:PREDICTED: uncharacterized protein LOC105349752 [Fragaria vesca subsp. vesca]